jgi:polyphosphate glucokinase
LVIDVGGAHVKVLESGDREPRKFESGLKLTAKQMVAGMEKIVGDWKYDAVSIGFPGPVLRNRPVAEPVNLGQRLGRFRLQIRVRLSGEARR